MAQYVNRYSGAVNPDRDEVVLNFFQEVPVMDLSDDAGSGLQQLPLESVDREKVATLVMTRDCAQNLLALLSRILEDVSNN